MSYKSEYTTNFARPYDPDTARTCTAREIEMHPGQMGFENTVSIQKWREQTRRPDYMESSYKTEYRMISPEEARDARDWYKHILE